MRKWREANRERAAAAELAWREANREKVAAKNKAYQEASLARVNALKGGGCQDCGAKLPPSKLHWHHRDPLAKVREVARMVSCARKTIDAEIAKCDLLCEPCHVERHRQMRLETSTETVGSRGPMSFTVRYVGQSLTALVSHEVRAATDRLQDDIARRAQLTLYDTAREATPSRSGRTRDSWLAMPATARGRPPRGPRQQHRRHRVLAELWN